MKSDKNYGFRAYNCHFQLWNHTVAGIPWKSGDKVGYPSGLNHSFFNAILSNDGGNSTLALSNLPEDSYLGT